MLQLVSRLRVAIVSAMLFAICVLTASSAVARPNYFTQWRKLYLTEKTTEKYDKLIKKQAKCFVCHQGKKKKNHNDYGELLEDLIKEKEKDKEKITKAIQKVGKMHSDPKDKKSPTYDELIAKGKLPGGKLADLKKEPKKKDGSDNKDEGSDNKDEGSDKKDGGYSY